MPITSQRTKFGKLIRDYLRNAEIRQKDLAAQLQITGSAVSQMMHGKIVPNQQQLNVICELLQLDRAQVFELQSMLSCIRTGAENMRSPFNTVMSSLRCQRGLSLQQLANLSGIPIPHLEVVESSFEATPTLDEANKFAPILGCTPAALLQSAGVGGLSRMAIDQLITADDDSGDKDVSRVKRQIPLLNLLDLAEFDGKSLFLFAQCANKAVDWEERDLPDGAVAISASGRDLAIGMPGSVLVLVAEKRPAGYRELDLCRTEDGKFVLLEMRQRGVKAFRLAGVRKSNTSPPLWKLPVLEIIILSTKSEFARKKADHLPPNRCVQQ